MIKAMIQKEEILHIIEEIQEGTPVFLTDIEVTKDNDITVYIEKDNGEIDLGDCESLSNLIEEKLDREIEDYSLTVSSAGLDRPFKVIRQYLKFKGKEIEILLKDGEKLKCTLNEVRDNALNVSYTAMVKPEGKKRKVRTEMSREIGFDQIKQAMPYINFR